MRGPEGTPVGCIRRINISNVTVYNSDVRRGSIITGIPGHPIEDLKLNNIRIYYAGGGTTAQAQATPPEKENAYPDPLMFTEMPSYGFFIRHVKGIEMTNVQVSYLKDDVRPPFVLEDVTGSEFNHVKADHMPGTAIFSLKDVKDFNTYRVRSLTDVHVDSAAVKQF